MTTCAAQWGKDWGAGDESDDTITQQRRGDTTDVMLDYVGYSLDELRATYAQRVAAAELSAERAEELSAALEAGLTGYTYLSDEPLA